MRWNRKIYYLFNAGKYHIVNKKCDRKMQATFPLQIKEIRIFLDNQFIKCWSFSSSATRKLKITFCSFDIDSIEMSQFIGIHELGTCSMD